MSYVVPLPVRWVASGAFRGVEAECVDGSPAIVDPSTGDVLVTRRLHHRDDDYNSVASAVLDDLVLQDLDLSMDELSAAFDHCMVALASQPCGRDSCLLRAVRCDITHDNVLYVNRELRSSRRKRYPIVARADSCRAHAC